MSDADLDAMQKIDILPDRLIQDYRSTYNDTRDWLRRQKDGELHLRFGARRLMGNAMERASRDGDRAEDIVRECSHIFDYEMVQTPGS